MGLDMYLREKQTVTIHSWRKANAIHGWIVSNWGDEDNCTPIHLPMQAIVDLRDVCAEVVRVGTTEVAEELLPPTPGFFFGSNEVDDWYWENVKETLAFLNELISTSDEHQEFEYQASW